MVLHDMRNDSILETTLVEQLITVLRYQLPNEWTVQQRAPDRRYAYLPDALIEVAAPDGSAGTIVLEVKASLEASDVSRVLDQVQRYPADAAVIGAPYVSDRTRELLDAANVGYLDTTGNLSLSMARPAIRLKVLSGVRSNPYRTDRPFRSLRGSAAGRCVRALTDFRPPFGVRELASKTGLIPGTLSRVLTLLESEALVTRTEGGQIASVDWEALLTRWAADYSFSKSNEVVQLLEPRGLDELQRKLRRATVPYAITGSLAAEKVAPIAPVRLVSIFVDSVAEASRDLGLSPTATGANVLLAEPFDPVALERTRVVEGLVYAALPQVVADLMTGPGRSPNEARALTDWMRANEAAWRA